MPDDRSLLSLARLVDRAERAAPAAAAMITARWQQQRNVGAFRPGSRFSTTAHALCVYDKESG